MVCAVFTKVFDLDYSLRIFYTFFTTFTSPPTLNDYCQVDVAVNASQPADAPPTTQTSSNCNFCFFPLLSTLISAGFTSLFLVVAWRVTHRIAASVINRRLIRRLRTLQFVVALLLPIGVVCRGVTVLFIPFELGFEILRFVNVSHSILLRLAKGGSDLVPSHMLRWCALREWFWRSLRSWSCSPLTTPM